MSDDWLDAHLDEVPVRDGADAEAQVTAITSAWQAGRAARRRRRAAGAALAVAAAVLLVLLPRLPVDPDPADPDPAPAVAAADLVMDSADFDLPTDDRIVASADADHQVEGTFDDRVVRLSEGSVTCTVAHRAGAGRFRVLVGDDVVEVVGTLFTASAHHGELVSVDVEEGSVRVTVGDRSFTLGPGERWPAVEPVEAPAVPPVEERRNPAPEPAPAPELEPVPPAGGAASSDGPSPIGALQDGMAAMDRGAFEEAARALGAVTAGPLAEDAAFWRAIALRRADDPGAEGALRAFLEGYPNAARAGEAHCVLARLLMSAGRETEAVPHFEAAAASPEARAAACGEAGLAGR